MTRLIALDYHEQYKHQHHESALNKIRQRFYIPNLRNVFNSVRRHCQYCKNGRAQPLPPMMAQLPPARLASFSRPFSFVGIDYFGPLTVTIHRRTEKRCGVLLICLTTRGIHIEVAHSLSTDSCILAIRNCTARRGLPVEFHCDNGTNFRGAERELKEAYANLNKEKLMETFTSTMTKWVFIPPGSPHMGGSWESLVRSVKSTLAQTMFTRNPSEELLRSSLIKIESIINSRPLTYLPISSEFEEALTPNHFLLGSSSGVKPLAIFNDNRLVLKSNWMTSQQYADKFWMRWVQEYLPTITRRSKWFTPAKPIEVGNIIIIADPNSPRSCWPKGKVIDKKISSDGQVRSATIQTSSGVYERPAVKLAVLDVDGINLVKSTHPSGHTGGTVTISVLQPDSQHDVKNKKRQK
ncbi:uncharacterized protein LOC129941741 [Eupeodes corollae]|uniref:uncharacterized protein LOC129941741 n=1 Tax=Eupeodes corollae TaxID=290404 RepID=UPI00248FCB77|nr:uncharacterized protein LOC129941741 [Eupeodes corollae]